MIGKRRNSGPTLATLLSLVLALTSVAFAPSLALAQQIEECNDSSVQGGTNDDDDGDGDGTHFNSDDPFAAGSDPQCHAWFDDDESPPIASGTSIKPRLLIIFDTSGSMAFNVCESSWDGSTHGDGSIDVDGSGRSCAGNDSVCGDDYAAGECDAQSCGNGLADDSRIYKVKEGVADAVAAFGEIEWGLMRFQQAPRGFDCDTGEFDVPGGWNGSCTGIGSGEVLVSFSSDNTQSILKWMDHTHNRGSVPGSGFDWELRPEGPTPLEGSMTTAESFLDDVKTLADPASSCRPYEVILVTDGSETCGGAPNNAAASLFNSGVPVRVIGFATTNPTLINQFNDIADHGDDGIDNDSANAILASNAADLSNALATIVASVALVEKCNGVDDDCDLAVDEGFPVAGFDSAGTPVPAQACDNDEEGVCYLAGIYECNLATVAPPASNDFDFHCTDGAGTPLGPGIALCPDANPTSCCNTDGSADGGECCNSADDDCDGKIDEGLAGCNCSPFEFCDGIDNDCDGQTDERDPPGYVFPGEGGACLTELDGIGICSAGTTVCNVTLGQLECTGGQGPEAELCDGVDSNCNNVGDDVELSGSSCYTLESQMPGGVLTKGCDPADPGNCLGECQHGTQDCANIPPWGYTTCSGEIGPVPETCNGRDDDCDGSVDEDFMVGQSCTITTGTPSAATIAAGECVATGVWVCDGSGGQVCNAIPYPASPEVCDNKDNDCNGPVDDALPSPVGDNCGGGCGIFACQAGVLVCDPTGGSGTTEVCDGVDNNCNGLADEDFPFKDGLCTDDPLEYDPPRSNADIGECEYGALICVSGSLVCDGYIGPQPEICDGLDNDCDGMADNMATCPSPGDLCVEGQCASPCNDDTEFRCPFGFICRTLPDGMGGTDDFCVSDPCKDITCNDGESCDSDTGTCVDLCEDVSCANGAICNNGFCIDCFLYDCDEGEVCEVNESGIGVCAVDQCAGVDCGDDAYCSAGECISLTCDPTCGSGESCQDGECVADPCDGVVCGESAVCNPDSGKCEADSCADAFCGPGEVCVSATGDCAADPCTQTQCPTGLSCDVSFDGEASCVEPKGDLIYAGGGSGCRATTGSSRSGLIWFLGLALVALRRRRR